MASNDKALATDVAVGHYHNRNPPGRNYRTAIREHRRDLLDPVDEDELNLAPRTSEGLLIQPRVER
jgi:hypothetical protein